MNDIPARITAEIKKVIHGKDDVIKMTLCAILAGGHVLLEDIPGVGKTTLAVAISKALSLKYQRVQFTPDVLPSDLLGFQLYDKNSGEFRFQEGSIYTNLFLRFKIARVLKCDLGADARYFTKYQAPDYNPAIGQFVVQENEVPVEVGNYPVVNVYANFHLQHTRFFVMMSHVNAGSGKRNYFFTPHYPLNERILRFGLSWNFFN